MAKRNKLEIIKDMLEIVRSHPQGIKATPLLRKSNLSSQRFSEYYAELVAKAFIVESTDVKGHKLIALSEQGNRYLEKYRSLMGFIEEFDL